MDIKVVNETRKKLEEDLKNNPHTLSNPLAHGVSRRKIMKYIYSCVLVGISKPDCVDWLYNLYSQQNDKDCYTFKTIIDSIAVAVYDFYDYINVSKIG